MAWVRRTLKEKRIHYTQVAAGKKPVKKNSKFTEKEQVAYAKGQRDALNEAARITAFKHATPMERENYRQQRAVQNAAWREKRKQGGNQ